VQDMVSTTVSGFSIITLLLYLFCVPPDFRVSIIHSISCHSFSCSVYYWDVNVHSIAATYLLEAALIPSSIFLFRFFQHHLSEKLTRDYPSPYQFHLFFFFFFDVFVWACVLQSFKISNHGPSLPYGGSLFMERFKFIVGESDYAIRVGTLVCCGTRDAHPGTHPRRRLTLATQIGVDHFLRSLDADGMFLSSCHDATRGETYSW